MVKNDDEFALLYSSNPPNHEQISIEVTLLSISTSTHIYHMGARVVAYKVLQLARPQSIVLVEWMLVRHGLESGDFLFLGDDFLGCVVENGFHWFA